jgi:DNA-binding NarL/FixJ family response regulator
MLDAHGFDVVAQAGDAPDLVRKVGAHRPDAAVIDIRMPPTNTDDGLRAPWRSARPTPTCEATARPSFAEVPTSSGAVA